MRDKRLLEQQRTSLLLSKKTAEFGAGSLEPGAAGTGTVQGQEHKGNACKEASGVERKKILEQSPRTPFWTLGHAASPLMPRAGRNDSLMTVNTYLLQSSH